MRVFKFGGASVKDATGVRNVVKLLTTVGHKNILIVVSAMGKTTNALEVVLDKYINETNSFKTELNTVKNYHHEIMIDLFKNQQHEVFNKVDALFQELLQFFKSNKSPNYNFIYDQIIPFGELLASKIINEYFNSVNIKSEFKDVRELIKTDSFYRNANINWELTQANILKTKFLNKNEINKGHLIHLATIRR